MKKPHSALTCQSEADPAGFASLCGNIDSIAHLKHEAKELSDKQCQKAKQISQDPLTHCSCADHVQDIAATRVKGEQLHAAMMTGHKHVTSSDDDVVDLGDEGRLADTSVSRSGEHAASWVSKQVQLSTLCCQTTHPQLEQMIEATERQMKQQTCCTEQQAQCA